MSYWSFDRSPVGVRLLLDFGQAQGVPGSALLRGTRLTAARLADPNATVSAQQELQVGLAYHLSAYGILGYGLMSSATGGAWHGAFCR